MPVWTVTAVEELPEDALTSWSIFELPDGDRHLAGFSTKQREGRATSAVREFDLLQLKAVMRSGRVYTLAGRPGLNSEAQYVWQRWCGLNDVKTCVDVSAQVLKEHVLARAAGEP